VTARRAGAPHTIGAAGLFLLGAWLRAANLGASAFSYDELYNVFAARRWLEGLGLSLPDGRPYPRAALATLLEAASFALFGEGEAQARLPAVAFSLLTMALVYAAGRALFGPAAGLVALALTALSPDAVDLARFGRLYSPLAFFVLLAALAAYRALDEPAPGRPWRPASRPAWAALAFAAGGVALHLHSAAASVGAVVLAYAAVVAVASALGGRPAAARRHAAVAAALLVCGGALFAASPGLRARLVNAALTPLGWYQPGPDDLLAYHYDLARRYAWLWYLAWPATLVALLARPRPALLPALAFWLPFAVLSAVVPTKQPRYVAYLLPFLWLLQGAAAAALAPAAMAAAERALARLAPLARGDRARWAAAGLLAVALLPVVRLTPSFVLAFRRPYQATGAFTGGVVADWRGAAAALAGQLPPDARIVSRPLASLYYLGRPSTPLSSVRGAADLAALRADGRPVVILVERIRWEAPGKFDPGLVAAVRATCGEVPLPASTALVAYSCDGPPVARIPRGPGPALSGQGRPPTGGSPPDGSPR
jgi:4-amino-4-deoxy-L-arabinose transferase-like glycosyltransferase